MELHNASRHTSQSQATHSTPTINMTGTTSEIQTTETNAAGDELVGAESDVTAEAATAQICSCDICAFAASAVSARLEELDEATELGALVHQIFSRAALVE